MAVDMKRVIADTLTALLTQKSVDKITVKELVAACGISRQSFYYHFQDIMDVIEWSVSQAIQESVEISLAAQTPRDALKSVILSLQKDGKLIQHLMGSQRRAEIERMMVKAMRTYLREMIQIKESNLPVSYRDMEAAIRFLSYGLVGMLMENLNKGQDADFAAQQLLDLITGLPWTQAKERQGFSDHNDSKQAGI